VVKTVQALESLHTLLKSRQVSDDPYFSFQMSVSGDGQLEGLAVCVHGQYGPGIFYVTILGNTDEPEETLRHRAMLLLADTSIAKVTFCLKDQLVSLSHHVDVVHVTDVLLEAWLLNPDDHVIDCKNTNLGGKVRILEGLLERRGAAKEVTEVHAVLAQFRDARTTSSNVGEREKMAVKQAALALLYHRAIQTHIRARRGQVPLRESEMPLVPVLARMEMTGMAVDLRIIQQQLLSGTRARTRLEEKALQAVPSWIRYTQPSSVSIDLRSPQRVSHLLYRQLSLPTPPTVKISPHGHLSVKEVDLKQLRGLHPVVSMILAHRRIYTQLDAMQQLMSSSGLKADRDTDGGGHDDGCTTARVHASFQQTESATGRVIVTAPSLQNIPGPVMIGSTNNGQESYDIRAAFVAPPGYCIMRADYCQVELRMIAHFSGDRALWLALCKSAVDPFVALASNWKKIAPNQVNKNTKTNREKRTEEAT
jgi:DNA polymerase I-like protein with 3'-5' exonuclease and polymerase domains